MTIRKKIFLLAGILPALFGVVVGALATVQKLNSDQIGNLVDYALPLSRLVAEFDVDTDRYELDILRVLRLDPVNPEQLQAAIAAKQALTDELRADVATTNKLLGRAIQDPRYHTAGRVDLARIQESFKYLSRSLEDFLTLGDATMVAFADGRRDDARTASLGFAKFAQAFGPDLSEIRSDIANQGIIPGHRWPLSSCFRCNRENLLGDSGKGHDDIRATAGNSLLRHAEHDGGGFMFRDVHRPCLVHLQQTPRAVIAHASHDDADSIAPRGPRG